MIQREKKGNARYFDNFEIDRLNKDLTDDRSIEI